MGARRRTDELFALLLGAGLALGSIVLGTGALRDWLRFHDAPIPLGVDEAARTSREGRQWVEVTADWQCDRTRDQNRVTWVPAWTRDGAVVVARFFDLTDCAQSTSAGVRGVIEPMSPDDETNLAQQGLVTGAEPGIHLLAVCKTCGRDDARLGVILCSLGLLLGVGFLPILRGFGRGGDWLGRRFVAAGIAPVRSPPPAAQDLRLAGRDAVLCGLGVAAVGGASALLDRGLTRAGDYYRVPVGLGVLGVALVVLGLVQWRTGRAVAFYRRLDVRARYLFVMAALVVFVWVGWPRLIDAIWPR